MKQRKQKRKSAPPQRANFKRKPKARAGFGGFALFGICMALCGGGFFAAIEIQELLAQEELQAASQIYVGNRLADSMINFN